MKRKIIILSCTVALCFSLSSCELKDAITGNTNPTNTDSSESLSNESEITEEKSRYIDPLTSLKNRNYLSANLDKWDDNKVYPQAVIVIDLNDLKDINNELGYQEGDIVIKAAANILINNQYL